MKNVFLRFASAAAAAAAMLSAAPSHAIEPLVLECRLSSPAQVRPGKAVRLAFSLTNPGSAPVSVLRWNTPLDGWHADYLAVERDGTTIPYRGPMIKRGPPDRSRYVTIAPGRTVRTTVNLARAYALERPGRYRIRFKGTLQDVFSGNSASWPRLDRTPLDPGCPEVAFAIGGR